MSVSGVIAAGRDVDQHEGRFAADAADEGEALAVGRGGRADRAAGAGDIGLDVAGLPVEALDDVDLAVDVLAEYWKMSPGVASSEK